MSFEFNATGQVRYVQLSNIPRNIHLGYGDTTSGGMVRNSDGSFLIYVPVVIEGIDDPLKQISYNHSVKFKEIPCDSEGNPQLISWWVAEVEGYKVSELVYLMMDFYQEPTHRVNLTTGDIIADTSDNNYIKNITLTYSIAE